MPLLGSLLSLTIKVAGQTIDINQVTIWILDLAYLLRPASIPATPSLTTTLPSKRSGRWDGRAAPSTPSKRSYISESANKDVNLSGANITMQGAGQGILDLIDADSSTEVLSVPTSLSSMADPGGAHLDSGTRPYRNRYPPRKYTKAK